MLPTPPSAQRLSGSCHAGRPAPSALPRPAHSQRLAQEPTGSPTTNPPAAFRPHSLSPRRLADVPPPPPPTLSPTSSPRARAAQPPDADTARQHTDHPTDERTAAQRMPTSTSRPASISPERQHTPGAHKPHGHDRGQGDVLANGYPGLPGGAGHRSDDRASNPTSSANRAGEDVPSPARSPRTTSQSQAGHAGLPPPLAVPENRDDETSLPFPEFHDEDAAAALSTAPNHDHESDERGSPATPYAHGHTLSHHQTPAAARAEHAAGQLASAFVPSPSHDGTPSGVAGGVPSPSHGLRAAWGAHPSPPATGGPGTPRSVAARGHRNSGLRSDSVRANQTGVSVGAAPASVLSSATWGADLSLSSECASYSRSSESRRPTFLGGTPCGGADPLTPAAPHSPVVPTPATPGAVSAVVPIDPSRLPGVAASDPRASRASSGAFVRASSHSSALDEKDGSDHLTSADNHNQNQARQSRGQGPSPPRASNESPSSVARFGRRSRDGGLSRQSQSDEFPSGALGGHFGGPGNGRPGGRASSVESPSEELVAVLQPAAAGLVRPTVTRAPIADDDDADDDAPCGSTHGERSRSARLNSNTSSTTPGTMRRPPVSPTPRVPGNGNGPRHRRLTSDVSIASTSTTDHAATTAVSPGSSAHSQQKQNQIVAGPNSLTQKHQPNQQQQQASELRASKEGGQEEGAPPRDHDTPSPPARRDTHRTRSYSAQSALSSLSLRGSIGLSVVDTAPALLESIGSSSPDLDFDATLKTSDANATGRTTGLDVVAAVSRVSIPFDAELMSAHRNSIDTEPGQGFLGALGQGDHHGKGGLFPHQDRPPRALGPSDTDSPTAGGLHKKGGCFNLCRLRQTSSSETGSTPVGLTGVVAHVKSVDDGRPQKPQDPSIAIEKEGAQKDPAGIYVSKSPTQLEHTRQISSSPTPPSPPLHQRPSTSRHLSRSAGSGSSPISTEHSSPLPPSSVDLTTGGHQHDSSPQNGAVTSAGGQKPGRPAVETSGGDSDSENDRPPMHRSPTAAPFFRGLHRSLEGAAVGSSPSSSSPPLPAAPSPQLSFRHGGAAGNNSSPDRRVSGGGGGGGVGGVPAVHLDVSADDISGTANLFSDDGQSVSGTPLMDSSPPNDLLPVPTTRRPSYANVVAGIALATTPSSSPSSGKSQPAPSEGPLSPPHLPMACRVPEQRSATTASSSPDRDRGANVRQDGPSPGPGPMSGRGKSAVCGALTEPPPSLPPSVSPTTDASSSRPSSQQSLKQAATQPVAPVDVSPSLPPWSCPAWADTDPASAIAGAGYGPGMPSPGLPSPHPTAVSARDGVRRAPALPQEQLTLLERQQSSSGRIPGPSNHHPDRNQRHANQSQSNSQSLSARSPLGPAEPWQTARVAPGGSRQSAATKADNADSRGGGGGVTAHLKEIWADDDKAPALGGGGGGGGPLDSSDHGVPSPPAGRRGSMTPPARVYPLSTDIAGRGPPPMDLASTHTGLERDLARALEDARSPRDRQHHPRSISGPTPLAASVELMGRPSARRHQHASQNPGDDDDDRTDLAPHSAPRPHRHDRGRHHGASTDDDSDHHDTLEEPMPNVPAPAVSAMTGLPSLSAIAGVSALPARGQCISPPGLVAVAVCSDGGREDGPFSASSTMRASRTGPQDRLLGGLVVRATDGDPSTTDRVTVAGSVTSTQGFGHSDGAQPAWSSTASIPMTTASRHTAGGGGGGVILGATGGGGGGGGSAASFVDRMREAIRCTGGGASPSGQASASGQSGHGGLSPGRDVAPMHDVVSQFSGEILSSTVSSDAGGFVRGHSGAHSPEAHRHEHEGELRGGMGARPSPPNLQRSPGGPRPVSLPSATTSASAVPPALQPYLDGLNNQQTSALSGDVAMPERGRVPPESSPSELPVVEGEAARPETLLSEVAVTEQTAGTVQTLSDTAVAEDAAQRRQEALPFDALPSGHLSFMTVTTLKFTPRSGAELKAVVHAAPGLTSLDVSGAAAVPGGAFGCLMWARSLESLDVSRTSFGDGGAAAVATLPGLQRLDVSWTRVRRGGTRHLLHCPVLVSLEADGVEVDPEVTAAIEDRIFSQFD